MPDEVARLIAEVYEAAGALRQWGETVAAVEGQTQSRWQVLSVLSTAAITVPGAARRLGISRQAVQRTVHELAGDGLIRSIPNPDHRTASLTELTEDGRALLERMTQRAAMSHDRLTSVLPPADIAHAREVLQRLVREVRAEPT